MRRIKRKERKRRTRKEEVAEKGMEEEEEDLNEKIPFACPLLISSSNGREQREIPR